MRLTSQSSQFVFNLPADLLPQEIINSYKPLLELMFCQYDNVIDYLNSTIKSVNFPGIAIQTPKQIQQYGKTREYKPATNINDVFSSHELNVTFRSVDGDTNYWLLVDIFFKNYIRNDQLFSAPFILQCLNIKRDAIYTITFYEITTISQSDNLFDYSQQKVNPKEFTVTFKFNYIDVNFNLNNTKVMEFKGAPKIINKK